MERLDDNGAAHGLRQHSIGPSFPAIIVGQLTEDLRGTRYYVQFMGHRTIHLPGPIAEQAGANIARIYREHGYEKALKIFKNAVIYRGTV